MMAAYVLMFKWLLAGLGCALAGLATYGLLKASLRAWPALAFRRDVWLAAQIVVACAALLPFLPHGEQISVAPAVTFGAQEVAVLRGLSQPHDSGGPGVVVAHDAEPVSDTGHANDADHGRHLDPAAHPAHAARAAPPAPALNAASILTMALPVLWALLYSVGLGRALIKTAHARALWRRLLAAAQHLSPQDLMAHGAFDRRQLSDIAQSRLIVMETDTAISPVLIGWWRPVLLLPRHLRDFSGEQQQMIVAHELHHWRAGDPLCLSLSAALQTIFWFNPALRWLGAKMTWALELACDQQVLAGRSQQQRKHYAAALLLQWKTQTTMLPHGGVAFGGFDFKGGTVAARILHMQQMSPPALKAAASWTVALLMAAVPAVGAVLQPALAFNIDQRAQSAAATVISAAAAEAPSASTSPAASASDLMVWRHPLDMMRVSGFFGVQRSVSDRPHQGIDLAAPKGTPVHAAAAGTVTATGRLAENEGRYGTTVIVDTGSMQVLYAHLNSVAVKAGDRVAPGQLIGAVGDTGFATGPHLHFEVRENNRAIDPATVLADLDAHATRRALKVRRQQQGY